MKESKRIKLLQELNPVPKDKKLFLDWLDKYSTCVEYEETVGGTYYLNICGYDGGNITKNGLKLFKDVRFDQPETVDEWYKEVAAHWGIKEPEMSFAEFYKTNK